MLAECFVGRKAKKQAQKSSSTMPDLKDHEDVQRFFLQEVNTIPFVSIVTFICGPFKLSLICNAIVT